MEPLERIYEVKEELGLDAILLSDPCNIRYISGFTGGEGYVYLSGSQKLILTDSRYTVQAGEEGKGFLVLEAGPDDMDCINGLLAGDGVQRLGFESRSLSAADYLNWKKQLCVEELVPLEDRVTKLRAVKMDWELERIKKAQAITDQAFSYIIGVIKPGMTELAVAAHLEFFMKQNGAQRLSFDTIAASGVHSAMPHAAPTDKKLERGEFLTMDFGCVYDGYCSDMTRTVVIGRASKEQRAVYQVVRDAQEEALGLLRAGRTGREVDRAARERIKAAGYGENFGHGLGHSVGLFIHEEPRLSPKEETVLKAGMVVTVEPGIYIRGFGGVRIEDLAAVTEQGCTNFTISEKRLIEL